MHVKKMGITLVASLASLSTGLMTAHAAVQSQSQTIQVNQGQSLTASQNSQVNETNAAGIYTDQVQSQQQESGSSATNSKQNDVQDTESTSSNHFSGGSATQGQQVGLKSSQQQTGSGLASSQGPPSDVENSTLTASDGSHSSDSQHHSGGNSSSDTVDTTRISGSIQFSHQLTSDISLATKITQGPPDPSHFTGPILGYAVFDLQGHEISDTYGEPGNARNHYDQFRSNQPVVLILMPVGSNGKPVRAETTVNVFLKSSNSSSKMTVNGKGFDGLIVKAGSYGVPFVYTNTGSTSKYDVIDRFFPKKKNTDNQKSSNSGAPGSGSSGSGSSNNTPNSSQSGHVEAVQSQDSSSTSGVIGIEGQTTSSDLSQSQDNVSQGNSSSTSQLQAASTTGSSHLKQKQSADVQTSSAQSSSSSTDASGTLHVQLGQGQSAQSNSGSASESESATFGVTGMMQVYFDQHQDSSPGDALQWEGIGVTASDPNGAKNDGGNLSVYLNGHLTGSYSGVTGNVSASQSQSTDTSGKSSGNKESDSVTYQQGGKTVSVQVG